MSLRRLGVALALACLAPVRHAIDAQAGSTIPDSLSDREFWQLVSGISENAGDFPSENFVSNEKTFQYVIPALQKTLTPGGVYLGVGPEQNFTYIENLQPRLAVIFDIRRQNAMLHLMYKALFELSSSRSDFVSRLFSRQPTLRVDRSAPPDSLFIAIASSQPSDSMFDANWRRIVEALTVRHGFALSDDDLQSMRHVFDAFREAGPEISYAYRIGRPPTPTAWLVTFAELMSMTNAAGENMAFLATEDRFRRLQAMERKNLVVPIVADFAGPTALRRVAEYVKQRHAVVTAFYVSNVEEYLFNTHEAGERFYHNVQALAIDSTSVFIRAVPSRFPAPGSLVIPADLPGKPTSIVLQNVDSAGVRLTDIVVRDTMGQVTRVRAGRVPATPLNTSAYVSGISSIERSLDSFAKGDLTSYAKVTALTKTEAEKQP